MNIFPGPYTREKCVYTLQFYIMLKRCGDVPDYWQKYVKPHYKRGWDTKTWNRIKVNRTNLYIRKCMKWHSNYNQSLLELCPLPCHEMTSKVIVKQLGTTGLKSTSTYATFHIESRVTEVTEVPIYTIDNFFSDIGSWLGLLVGMSCLSVVEVITFFFTAIREQCCKFHRAAVRPQ